MKKKCADGANEIRAQLPRIASATGAATPDGGRNLPQIPISQPLASLSLAVGQCLSSAPIFRRGAGFFTVDELSGEQQPMTSTRWRSWHQRAFVFYDGDGDKRRIVNVNQDVSQCILASDEVRKNVREISAVNLLRLPAWRGTGAARTVELLPNGYDDATKTFTVPVLDYAIDWGIEDAHAWLDQTFGTFPFFETGPLFERRSFGAHVCAMLGVYAVNLLPRGAVRPMIVVNGNQPGLGKTLLVHAQLAPVYGPIEDDSKPKDDGELRSVLDAADLGAAPYLVLDDCSNLRSHDLNKFVTSPLHVPRVKGKSVRVRCDNITQVFATGNALNLTEDLDRRSLVVDLFDPRKAAERMVLAPLTNSDLFDDDYRARACAAFWAMVRRWQEAGCMASPEARKPSFEAYAKYMGGIVMAANIANPFAQRACVSGGDEASRALEAVLCRLAAERSDSDTLTPDDILDALREAGTLDDVLTFGYRDERRALGHKLRKLKGRIFTDTGGRRFEFGKREDASGAKYVLRFFEKEGTD